MASVSRLPKRSFSIDLVAATASRERCASTSAQCSTRASSSAAGTISVAKPCSRAQAASRSTPVSSSSRAAVSPSTSGNSSVPALLATRPMPISGVSSRMRSLHRRMSQLAANSSAPPTQTPSTTAIAGRGLSSTTRVMRWNASIVAAQEVASALIAACRSSPAEKWSPAPRSTTQRSAGSPPAPSIASAIAVIVSRSQALRRSWRSQLTILAGPSSALVTVIWRLLP